MERASILIVDDNEPTREVLCRRFEERGYVVGQAAHGSAALEMVEHDSFDLVLLDIIMPGLDGLEVLRLLRRKHPPTELPVVMLTVKEGSDDIVKALRLEANDYVTKTAEFPVILARIQAQLALNSLLKQVQRMAVEDPLTKVYNRRGFVELAEKEHSRAKRYGDLPPARRPGTALQGIVADLDDFKRVNDTHGHKVGDQVLVAVARRCRRQLRACDLLGRWGGEEFAVLLPETDLEGARRCGERLRRAVGSEPVETDAGPLRITLTAGIASLDAAEGDLEELFHRADRALYEGKRTGKNRVVVWDETLAERDGS